MKERLGAVLVALALMGVTFGVARWAASDDRPSVQKRLKARKAKMRKAKRKGKAKGKGKGTRSRQLKAGKAKRKAKLGAKEARQPILAGPAREVVISDPPNVVLIIGCTVRADQLTPYSGHPEATPHLARRAEHGALFEGGVTAAPWTKAASAAILTGHHPAEIGMVEPDDRPSRRKLSEEATTLAERFKAAGYQTFGATANPNLNEVFGFAQGFDSYLEGTELWRLGGRSKVHGRALLTRAMPMVHELRDPEKPLFAQFLFTDAHFPSTVSRTEIERLRDGAPPRVATYRAMLHRFDMAIELLENSLAHQGISPSNTLFVFVSDHGEGLNQPTFHGTGHGNFTYPSAVRMPWMMWGPGVERGHRIDGMASQVDIVPTILDLAGVESDYSGPGKSWGTAVRGDADRTEREVAFVDTWFQSTRRSGVYAEDMHCHDDWNAIANEDGERRVPRACYDQDQTPLAVTGDRADALLAELDGFRASMEASFEAYPFTVDAQPPDDVKAELEALGYVDGGEGAPE